MLNFFLRVRIDFFEEDKNAVDLSPPFIENNVRVSLKQIFGQVGAEIPFKVLVKSSEDVFILATCAEFAVKLRTALTLQSAIQGRTCAYDVTEAGFTLLDL